MENETYHKYPKTPHLPWSENADDDDIFLPSVELFKGKEVIVTEKADGENTSFYRTHYHARSLDSRMHLSRAYIAQLHATVRLDIPLGERVCLENVYARHSIFYRQLPSYGLVFAYFDRNNVCVSWDDTVVYAEALGLTPVKVIWRGIWDEEAVRACFTNVSAYDGYDKPRKWGLDDWNFWCQTGTVPLVYEDSDLLEKGEQPAQITDVPKPCQEGYVVRLAQAFHYANFGMCVAKFVRKAHVRTSQHWMTEAIIPNKLKE